MTQNPIAATYRDAYRSTTPRSQLRRQVACATAIECKLTIQHRTDCSEYYQHNLALIVARHRLRIVAAHIA